MTDSPQPLVTVAIPVYNAAGFIVETINSVIDQDYTNLDILIIDNHSTDESWNIIQGFPDPRIRAVRNDKNIGAVSNFNKCLEMAQGEYFLLLPADDLLYPGSISRRVAVLVEDSARKLALCFCARTVIDVASKKVMNVSFCKPGYISREKLLQKNVSKGMNVIGEPAAGLFFLV